MGSFNYIIITYAIIISSIFLTHVRSNDVKTSETIDELYENGIEAYLSEDYQKCVHYMKQALEKYRVNRRKIENCRIKCKTESDNTEPLFPMDVEDLRFYERAVKNTLCYIKCIQSNLGNDGHINKKTIDIFEQRTPYEYLNSCYYKINDKQNAANAAFTYLVVHPYSGVMNKSLEKYIKMPEVKREELVNFEAKEYIYLYIYGSDSYLNKNWQGTVHNMEESLVAYLQADDECRADCEGSYDIGWNLDFIPALANHFTHVLKCKRLCYKKLGNLNGEMYDDLFVSHYDYLQYAYFKLGNLRATCEAVASFLLLSPNNEAMLANLKYYKTLPRVEEDYFTPRSEAVKYLQREKYETKILNFIQENFVFDKASAVNEEVEPSTENVNNGI